MYQNLQSKILKRLFLNSLILLGQVLECHHLQYKHLPVWNRILRFLISLKVSWVPPALLDAYSQQMKKVRGPKLPQPTVREQENSIQDEDQYSGTEISPGEAARIRDEVHGVMKQQFAQARAHAEAISNLEKKIAAQESRSKSVNATAEEDEDVIDLISKSAASLQKSPPSVLPSSPISVASTPSHVGNGGSAPGFWQLSSGSHPSPPPPAIRHNALEAKRASMLFRTQFRGCPHMDISGASLPYLYGR